MGLIAALKLPLDERGQRRAAARAEWFSAQNQPLELHDVVETENASRRDQRGHCADRRICPPYGPGGLAARGRFSMADKPRDGRQRAAPAHPPRRSSRAEIDAFLETVKSLGPAPAPALRGRLIFALDATMSRQPLWDTACKLQADMFREAAAIGGLDVQLVYYRGLGECRRLAPGCRRPSGSPT